MTIATRTKKGIRTEKSYLRQKIAKQIVEKLLARQGYKLEGTRTVKNRHLLDVVDPRGTRRVLWFKLGWNPGKHDTSAVQIEMIKKGASGVRPSELTDTEVATRVAAKFDRAGVDGVSDLLLFSLDNANKKAIACLVLPLERAPIAFRRSLAVDSVRARNGASPTLWLMGNSPQTLRLQSVVEGFASENLLGTPSQPRLSPSVDAYDDLEPDTELVGNLSPVRSSSLVGRFNRDPAIRDRVRRRAKGRCELCNKTGFLMANGERYIETHHIQALGEEGPDSEYNVIALCANDHREAHFGSLRDSLALKMKSIVREKLAVRRAVVRRLPK